MIATKSFESNSLEQLGKDISEWQNKNNIISRGALSFGFNLITQKYGVMCFYEEVKESKVATKKEVVSDSRSPKADNSQSAKPSFESVTDSQAVALELPGYSGIDISNMSKQEAWTIINESKKKGKK